MMMKRTDRLLIQLESISVIGLLILYHDTAGSVVLLIVVYLVLLNIYIIRSNCFIWELHTSALVDLFVELPLPAGALVILHPVFFLGFMAVWFYRLFDRVKTPLCYILAPIILLLLMPWGRHLPHMDEAGLGLIGLLITPIIGLLLARQEREQIVSLKQEITTQRLQIQNKNKLLSTLSHELRTPLTVIQTSTEILQEERPGPINETQKKFLDSTNANVRRMIRLVENILAQVKVEHTLFSLEKQEMDIRIVIRRVIRNMRPILDNQHQEVRYAFDNMIDHVYADDKWIEQVLINLIHNASKHVGSHGTILVTVKQNEQCMIVSVSDNGSGIDRDERPMIFNEFYQGRNTDNNILNGAGLGLAIVKDIIKKHGGKIYVSSVPKQGTMVSFTLPKENPS